MTLKVIPGAGQRAEDLTGEMAQRIREVVYEYGGRLPLAAAMGVLTIVQHELMADNDDAP
jgi:predicted outer membrane lipoprotein